MTPRNHLKSVRTKKSETMDQLESIGDTVEEKQIVMTTLNGLPRDWDYFIRGICSIRKLTKFQNLWEECVQEEERIISREENI